MRALHTEIEILQQVDLARAHLSHQDDYHLPLAQLSFPGELINKHPYGNYLYVELETSVAEPLVHILGTDWIQFYDKPLTQEYPIGRNTAWQAYKLSDQYPELATLRATIESSPSPKMWVASEMKLVQDYLQDFKTNAFMSGKEFVEFDSYDEVFAVLLFLSFGTLKNANGRFLFVYPKAYRQAVRACCDIDYLKSWKEQRELSIAIPKAKQTDRVKQKI